MIRDSRHRLASVSIAILLAVAATSVKAGEATLEVGMTLGDSPDNGAAVNGLLRLQYDQVNENDPLFRGRIFGTRYNIEPYATIGVHRVGAFAGGGFLARHETNKGHDYTQISVGGIYMPSANERLSGTDGQFELAMTTGIAGDSGYFGQFSFYHYSNSGEGFIGREPNGGQNYLVLGFGKRFGKQHSRRAPECELTVREIISQHAQP